MPCYRDNETERIQFEVSLIKHLLTRCFTSMLAGTLKTSMVMVCVVIKTGKSARRRQVARANFIHETCVLQIQSGIHRSNADLLTHIRRIL